jgi:uncharacterized protein YecT (DUF1311 family)
MKILLFIVAAFFVLPKGEGSEVKDPIDIAMDAAMDRNGSTAGMCEAIAEAHEKWEARLNTAWSKLKKKMPPEEFSVLQKAQRAWIAYRDLQIKSYEATYSKMDGTMWISISVSAVMNLTKERVRNLEGFLELLDARI